MTQIVFTYGAVENLNTGNGFLPSVTENGAPMMNTWNPHGYSTEDATVIALAKANELASRFVGDWDISIVADANQGTKR